jgi:2-haloalkanoic acid dehalogenase type II
LNPIKRADVAARATTRAFSPDNDRRQSDMPRSSPRVTLSAVDNRPSEQDANVVGVTPGRGCDLVELASVKRFGRRYRGLTKQVFADALDRVLDRHNVGEKFSTPDRARMTEVWAQMIPWPDTASGLERLRRKFALTALSNSGLQTVGKILKRLDLRFDYILIAELAHSFKPDGGVYRLVTQNLGVPVENVMMIACHKYDLKGAHEFGFAPATSRVQGSLNRQANRTPGRILTSMSWAAI